MKVTLSELRKRAGLTQAELAERMGVEQWQVVHAEVVDVETLAVGVVRRYVEALGETLRLHVDQCT